MRAIHRERKKLADFLASAEETCFKSAAHKIEKLRYSPQSRPVGAKLRCNTSVEGEVPPDDQCGSALGSEAVTKT